MGSVGRLLRPLTVVLLATFAFSSVVPGGGWVFDDHVLLERNADLKRSDVWVQSFTRDYYSSSELVGESGYYRPIPVTLNAMDMRVWQDAARGAHLTNLMLHVLVSLLWAAALMALGATPLAAWIVALLFAAHPVHAESVAFISGRVDVVATLFLLLGMVCAARRGLWAAVGVGLCALLAFLSKEIALVMPLLLILVWRTTATRNRWAPAWPRQQIIAMCIAGGVVLLLRVTALGSLLPATAHQVRPEGAWLLPVKALLFSLSSVYVPLRMISMEPDPSRLDLLRLIVGGLAALLFWGIAFARLQATAFLRRALLASGVSLILVLNLLPQETLLSERFLYLASGFLLAPLGVLAAAGWQRTGILRVVTIVAGVVVLTLLMSISHWRSGVWRTDTTVWRQAVREEPQRAAFWDRLGLALNERRSYNEAEVALRRAVDLDPNNANALHNMGVLLQSTQRPAEAIPFYQGALQRQPGNISTYLNLGQVLSAVRDYKGALEAFQTATRLKPDHVLAHRMAAMAAMSAQEPEQARRHLEAALRLTPQDPSLQQLLRKVQKLESRQGAPGTP